MQADNPPLPVVFRVFTALVLAVVVVASGLLFAPNTVRQIWPWSGPEFNLRFVGAAYLAGFVALVAQLAINRWSPGRLVAAMGLCFSLVALLASVAHLDQFDLSRPGVWAWFAVYIVSATIFGWLLWDFRRARHPGSPIVEPAWRMFFLVQAIAFGVLGLALLISPAVATAPWPYPVDDFHARVYSDIILAGAVGALLMWRSASRNELVVFGSSQVALGLGGLAALLFVRSGLGGASVAGGGDEWAGAQLAAWPWIVGSVAATALGIVSIGYSLRKFGLGSPRVKAA
jgi:hypothetical protein